MPNLKRHYLCCLLAVLAIGINGVNGQDRLANQLHVFLVADTNANVGKFCAQERDHLNQVLKEAFENAESAFQNRYNVVNIQGEDVTPDTILRKIKETEITPDDAVLFYYIGHGGVDRLQGHFLETSGGQLLRTKLRAALLEKKARMLAIFTESCSVQANFAPPSRQTPAKWQVIHDLFFVQTGLADIQSSQEGVVSWCGAFTHAMAANFCVSPQVLDTNEDGFVEWSEYFAALRRDTLRNFHFIRKGSEPDAEIQRNTPQEPHSFNLPSKPVPTASRMTLPGDKSQETFTSLSASGDGTRLLTGDSQGRLRLWDPVGGQLVKEFERPSQFIWSAVISGDGQYAMSDDLFHIGSGEELKSENVTRIWDVENGKQVRRFPSSLHGKGKLLLNQNQAVLTDSEQSRLTLLNWGDQQMRSTFKLKNKYLNGMAALDQGQTLRLVDNDPASGKCWVQTITTKNEKESFQEFPLPLRPFTTVVSTDGQYVALAMPSNINGQGEVETGRRTWEIEIWQCDGPKLTRVKVFSNLSGDLPFIAFSQNNRFLALAFREQTGGFEDMTWSTYPMNSQFQVWDLDNNRQALLVDDLPSQFGTQRYPRGVAFVNKAHSVAIAYGNEVRVYKLSSSE